MPRFPSYVGERADAKFDYHPKARPAPVQLFPAQAAAPKRRRFELHDDEQNAFWEIEVIGTKHRVRFRGPSR